MKIGIFGGTFNPPHKGHTRMIEKMAEELELDKVLIIPNKIPTHKRCDDLADNKHRVAMCKIAFNNPKFEVSTMEMDRETSSYTIFTVDELKTFAAILCPYAPHLCEEIWEQCGEKTLLAESAWPTYDEAKTVDATIEIAVQICGKLRSTIKIAKDASKDEAIAAAKADEKIVSMLEGKNIVKEIYVPGKIVNIVAK